MMPTRRSKAKVSVDLDRYMCMVGRGVKRERRWAERTAYAEIQRQRIAWQV